VVFKGRMGKESFRKKEVEGEGGGRTSRKISIKQQGRDGSYFYKPQRKETKCKAGNLSHEKKKQVGLRKKVIAGKKRGAREKRALV